MNISQAKAFEPGFANLAHKCTLCALGRKKKRL